MLTCASLLFLKCATEFQYLQFGPVLRAYKAAVFLSTNMTVEKLQHSFFKDLDETKADGHKRLRYETDIQLSIELDETSKSRMG